VVHYKGARYFLAGGLALEGEGLSQFAVGQKGYEGWEGTFKDAEDGLLSGNPIAQGSVDSVIGLSLRLPPPMNRGRFTTGWPPARAGKTSCAWVA